MAESIDLARAVVGHGSDALTPEAVASCAGTVTKHRDDVEIVRRVLTSVPFPEQRDRS